MPKDAVKCTHGDDEVDARFVEYIHPQKPGNSKASMYVALEIAGHDLPLTYKLSDPKSHGFVKGMHKPVKGTLVTISGLSFDSGGAPNITKISKSIRENFTFAVKHAEFARDDKKVVVLSGEIEGDHPRSGKAKLVVHGGKADALVSAFEVMANDSAPSNALVMEHIRMNVRAARETRDGTFTIGGME